MGKLMASKKPGEVYNMFQQIDKTDEIRSIVKSEIWDLVDVTKPKM
jgi:hypothetical protein